MRRVVPGWWIGVRQWESRMRPVVPGWWIGVRQQRGSYREQGEEE